ncbi:MAG: hypothetical protein ACC608_04270 [Anaerofustis sp.]
MTEEVKRGYEITQLMMGLETEQLPEEFAKRINEQDRTRKVARESFLCGKPYRQR